MTGTWLVILLVLLLIRMMMSTLPAVTSVEDRTVRLAFNVLRDTVVIFHRMNKQNAEGRVQLKCDGTR